MRHNSTSMDANVGDRPLVANAIMPMTNIENGDHQPFAGQPRQSRPLYQGREMGVGWNIGLRVLGMALIGAAAAAISWMYRLLQIEGSDPATFINFLLALIGFIGASFGSVLLFLGTHIFDEVEVSARWKPRT